MEIEELINIIKKKKELKNISSKVIYKIIIKELNKKQYLLNVIKKIKNEKELKRNEELNLLFKEIRKILNEIYGNFIPKDIKKIWRIIYDETLTLQEKIYEVLSLSTPTKERLNFYKEIYNKIFIDEPYEIMDMASGLNPISIFFSDKKPKKYYYIDISDDIIEINSYFLKEMNIEHEGYNLDLLEENEIIYRKYQYIFLWKTIPVLEKIDYYFVRRFLSKLNFDYLIISFPQKSIGKKRKLGLAWRYWIKKFSNKVGFKIIKEFDIPYEYFVIIKK